MDQDEKREEKKRQVIANLKDAGGIVFAACESTGISRTTYYNWYRDDVEFREKVDEVVEAQVDFVESKLMEMIKGGDTTAAIFYLKTKGKKRGWSERIQLQATAEAPTVPAPKTVEALPVAPEQIEDKRAEADERAKKIKNKRDYIVRILKKQGKYTPELSMQVGVVAQLLIRTEMLADSIFDSDHKAVNTEVTREGNIRESVSPQERLYLSYLEQSQRALRALGMNVDARERKTDTDGFDDFMKEFKDGAE